jgi:hypothetical protein
MKWTSRGAWVGIGVLVVIWLTVLFIGPGLGLWDISQ